MSKRDRPPLRRVATVRNLEELTFEELLDALQPYLLEEIPEGVTDAPPEDLARVDRLIGQLANTYSYITNLYAYSAAYARRAKVEGDTSEWHDWNAKKDALYRIVQAIELKWRACSRLVTVDSELGFERPDYQGREERAATRRPMRGWDNVNYGKGK